MDRHEINQQKFNKQLKDARFDVLRAQNYQKLLESSAWQEMEEGWKETISIHEQDKKERSLFSYDLATLHPWGKDKDGKALYINGTQFLEHQQREELRMEIFKSIMEEVRMTVQKGTDSAVSLNKYDAILKSKLKTKQE